MVLAGLTGCGVTPAPATTAAKVTPGPPAGSRSAALAAAGKLLREVVLPHGTRRLPQYPAPAGLGSAGVSWGMPHTSADEYRLYSVPAASPAAQSFILAHLPPRTAGSGSGTVGSRSGAELIVYTSPDSLPAGIDGMQLVYTIVAGPGGSSLVRVDVQVIWYPPRSPAEYLVASRFRSVRITALPSAATVTSTSPGVIGQVVHLVDTAEAAAHQPFGCPLITQFYSIVLTPAVAGQPEVDLDPTGCGTVTVRVGGRAQPVLEDNGMERLAFQLLHLKLMPAGPSIMVPTVLRHAPGKYLFITQVPRHVKSASG